MYDFSHAHVPHPYGKLAGNFQQRCFKNLRVGCDCADGTGRGFAGWAGCQELAAGGAGKHRIAL